MVINEFTEVDIQNRELVIKMLCYEDTLILGDVGTSYNTDMSYQPRTSLQVTKILHRLTLNHFGFTATDRSVENYRTIFAHYFKSPSDYDAEVAQSVAYFRNNKCIYYTAPIIEIGSIPPDCRLYEFNNNKTATSVLDQITKAAEDNYRYIFFGAFSLS